MPFRRKNKNNLENILLKKFENTKSVSKVIQKTMKLQKNLNRNIDILTGEASTNGDAIRYWIMQRISGFQKQRAIVLQNNNNHRKEPRQIHKKPLKLNYQYHQNKRKTRTFDMYEEKELDFQDVNNLLKKRITEYEFDNDINSDEDEIFTSSYIRLKELTIELKNSLNRGELVDNDPDDLEIKRTVGLQE